MDLFSTTIIITLYSDNSVEVVDKTKSGAPHSDARYTQEIRLAKMCTQHIVTRDDNARGNREAERRSLIVEFRPRARRRGRRGKRRVSRASRVPKWCTSFVRPAADVAVSEYRRDATRRGSNTCCTHRARIGLCSVFEPGDLPSTPKNSSMRPQARSLGEEWGREGGERGTGRETRRNATGSSSTPSFSGLFFSDPEFSLHERVRAPFSCTVHILHPGHAIMPPLSPNCRPLFTRKELDWQTEKR